MSAPLLMPGHQFDWIDDQIQASGTLGALSVRVGASPAAAGKLPQLSVQGMHLAEESASGESAEGTVVNRSAVAQQELVVFAVGRRSGRIVAAGRAVLPNVPSHSSTPFQVFFIGNPKGATLQVSAPPPRWGETAPQEIDGDYGRASRTRLKGVSAARLTLLNPPCLTTSARRASPAWAPSASPTSWESDAGVQITVEAP